MARGPGTRIVDEIDHGYYTIAGLRVHITESVWNGGAGSSFEVTDAESGDTLTMDEAFDEMPTRSEVRDLVLAERDQYGSINQSKPPREDPEPYSVMEPDPGIFMIYEGPYQTGPYPSRDEAERDYDNLEGKAE